MAGLWRLHAGLVTGGDPRQQQVLTRCAFSHVDAASRALLRRKPGRTPRKPSSLTVAVAASTRSGAARATSTVLASRVLLLERAVARVCQEAGAWVARDDRSPT